MRSEVRHGRPKRICRCSTQTMTTSRVKAMGRRTGPEVRRVQLKGGARQRRSVGKDAPSA
eukprot:492035-Alexandrium_andersonii.AAC.1